MEHRVVAHDAIFPLFIAPIYYSVGFIKKAKCLGHGAWGSSPQMPFFLYSLLLFIIQLVSLQKA